MAWNHLLTVIFSLYDPVYNLIIRIQKKTLERGPVIKNSLQLNEYRSTIVDEYASHVPLYYIRYIFLYIVIYIILVCPAYVATRDKSKLCAILFVVKPKIVTTLSRISTFYLLYGTNISKN